MSSHNIVVFAFLLAIIEKIIIIISSSNDDVFIFYTMYKMKNNNQSTNFSFSFSDGKAEIKRFSNPFDWEEKLWLAFVYESKAGFQKVATFYGVDITTEKMATIFDLLSVSTSCREVITILSGYDFTTEGENGELVQRVQEPRFLRIKKVR